MARKENNILRQIAIDFGSTNTLIAFWNGHYAECLELQDISAREPTWNTPQVPSVMYLLQPNHAVIGVQAQSAREMMHLVEPGMLSCWAEGVKPALLQDGLAHVAEVSGQRITAREAALLFLETLLSNAVQRSAPASGWRRWFQRILKRNPIEHLTMAVPVECHEPYRRELSSFASRLGIRHFSLLDEPVASALGYGVDLTSDRIILIVDFGGGTLNTAVVQTHVQTPRGGSLGNRSTVMAARGLINFGGRVIDQWVADAYLQRLPQGKGIEAYVRRHAESAKIALSSETLKEPVYMHAPSGVSVALTREEFIEMLTERGLYKTIDDLIDQTLEDLWSRYQIGLNSIEAVLPVGGSILLPNVRKMLMDRFGSQIVWWDSPFDAVVKGAAIYGAGALVEQIVHHDYAVRLYNETRESIEYELLVPRSTPYPSHNVLASRYYTLGSGQTEFRVPIYEIGYSGRRSVDWQRRADSQFWLPNTESEPEGVICLNAGDILRVNPPGDGKRVRLRLDFEIDTNRHLVMTVTDLLNQQTLRREEKVVQLR
ncbi:MAG: Hsp70 family protein [Fimbriimonadia bacterium]|nr:Hsp70 family protein [Fimbriimonadia bacterium]